MIFVVIGLAAVVIAVIRDNAGRPSIMSPEDREQLNRIKALWTATE